ncbi:MAG: DNA polymerase III subunit delta [Pseudomonadota bacterium]
MKLAARQIEPFLDSPATDVRVVLLYGPDRGLAADRRARLLSAWLDDPSDPLALTTVDGDALRADPARLLDETQAYAMLGGRRAVRVTDAGDPLAKIVDRVLALPGVEAPTVVEAGDLAANSTLRRACERHPLAAAIPCYRLEGTQLEAAIRAELDARGVVADAAAVGYLADSLGADFAVLKSELDKLDLYLGDNRRARLEDVFEAVGDSSVLALDALIHATALGNVDEAMRSLDRLLAAKQTPVSVLRALQNHWQRLYRLAIRVAAGEPAAQVVETARPPVFFRARPLVLRALRRSSATKLRHELALLLRAERHCKTSGMPSGLIAQQAVLEISGSVPGGPTPMER